MEETVFDRVKQLCKMNQITMKKLEQDLGISPNSAYRWKTFNPATETLNKLAEYFDVSQEYILTGKDTIAEKYEYYTDPETAELIEVIKTSPELKAIFRVTRSMPKERLDAIYNLIKDLK